MKKLHHYRTCQDYYVLAEMTPEARVFFGSGAWPDLNQVT